MSVRVNISITADYADYGSSWLNWPLSFLFQMTIFWLSLFTEGSEITLDTGLKLCKS